MGYCEMHQMDAVRALCPQTCGCQVSWPVTPGFRGFFATPAFGCPSRCSQVGEFNAAAFQEDRLVQMGLSPCVDVPEAFFASANFYILPGNSSEQLGSGIQYFETYIDSAFEYAQRDPRMYRDRWEGILNAGGGETILGIQLDLSPPMLS